MSFGFRHALSQVQQVRDLIHAIRRQIIEAPKLADQANSELQGRRRSETWCNSGQWVEGGEKTEKWAEKVVVTR